MSVRDEIRDAVARLQLPEAALAAVPTSEARYLVALLERKFTGKVGARWWWEHFDPPGTNACFGDDKAFTRLSRIVPDPNEHVWFVAEDTGLPFYPVFDATPAAIERVIGECYAFEYYLIAKDLSWLVCENHHGRLVAVGSVPQEKLSRLQQ